MSEPGSVDWVLEQQAIIQGLRAARAADEARHAQWVAEQLAQWRETVRRDPEGSVFEAAALRSYEAERDRQRRARSGGGS